MAIDPQTDKLMTNCGPLMPIANILAIGILRHLRGENCRVSRTFGPAENLPNNEAVSHGHFHLTNAPRSKAT